MDMSSSNSDTPAIKVIYDFGANNGDDLPYYLKKGDLTVAVEANPRLAELIQNRFEKEIGEKKLVVLNGVLTIGHDIKPVDFYIHKEHHVLSRFPRPADSEIDHFTSVTLPSLYVVDVIQKYGNPYYVKIDLEGYDHIILKEILLNNIRPTFISSESHSIEVFALLRFLGMYKSFKLVDGPTVETKYRDCLIGTVHGPESYSFPHHSAGPFGDDIEGSWRAPTGFFRYLVHENVGWKDIHATGAEPSVRNSSSDAGAYAFKVFMLKVAFNICRHDKQAMRSLMNRLRQQFSRGDHAH
jgi:FkbM family methyltransferase